MKRKDILESRLATGKSGSREATKQGDSGQLFYPSRVQQNGFYDVQVGQKGSTFPRHSPAMALDMPQETV